MAGKMLAPQIHQGEHLVPVGGEMHSEAVFDSTGSIIAHLTPHAPTGT